MKRLISILGSIGLMGIVPSAVVGCGKNKETTTSVEQPKKESESTTVQKTEEPTDKIETNSVEQPKQTVELEQPTVEK